jgi:hypothetical protein
MKHFFSILLMLFLFTTINASPPPPPIEERIEIVDYQNTLLVCHQNENVSFDFSDFVEYQNQVFNEVYILHSHTLSSFKSQSFYVQSSDLRSDKKMIRELEFIYSIPFEDRKRLIRG